VHHPRLIAILAALSAVYACGAGAQPVYRCGSSYSQQPCAGGTVVDTSDTANPPKTPPGSVAAADTARAAAMEKARLAQERNAPKALIIGPESPPLREPEPAAKPGKLQQFTAVAPGSKPPAKKKKKKKAA
jgi:hypothetical protein